MSSFDVRSLQHLQMNISRHMLRLKELIEDLNALKDVLKEEQEALQITITRVQLNLKRKNEHIKPDWTEYGDV